MNLNLTNLNSNEAGLVCSIDEQFPDIDLCSDFIHSVTPKFQMSFSSSHTNSSNDLSTSRCTPLLFYPLCVEGSLCDSPLVPRDSMLNTRTFSFNFLHSTPPSPLFEMVPKERRFEV